MNNKIIEVKQLPVIVEQLQTIKSEVTERVTSALSLLCTDETVKAVKVARADLKKDFTEWENKRKQVKSAVMLPYEQFEAVYKDCITDVFKNADIELKSKIDSVENELKEKKRTEVKEIFEEYKAFKNIDFVTFEQANINITLSVSTKALKLQATQFIDRICDDLNLIDTQEHKEEIIYEYKQNLNVSAAITTVTNRYKAIEEAKAREEEHKEKEQATTEVLATVENIPETVTPPTVEPIASPIEEEPILTLKITVKSTRTKLKALILFLESERYDYE